ncbi:MAG: ribosomal subunit interface protein [Candidatus Paceibacteria bacterium]|jgi:ribosomal subunit interface protein
MAFPMIQFKVTNTELIGELQDIMEQKLHSLEKYIGDETDVKCAVEFEKITSQHSGKIYRIETNLHVAGKLYRAESTETTFEEAIDEVRNELDKELRRANKKKETMVKKGGRIIKDMMKFGG